MATVFLSRTGPVDPMVVSWIGTAIAVGYAAYLTYTSNKKNSSDSDKSINPSIKKDQPKVVDSLDLEDLGTKSVFCRCWRSKKFPYCDGAHTKHNNECGDNVGPLIIQRKEIKSDAK